MKKQKTIFYIFLLSGFFLAGLLFFLKASSSEKNSSLGKSPSVTLNIAVASNFAPVLREISARFSKKTSVQVNISQASTAKLYIQIVNGASFDLFFAADQEHPQRLFNEGRSQGEKPQTYAQGQLAYWAAGQKGGTFPEEILKKKRLVIANPLYAPYGKAGKTVLEGLGYTGNLIQMSSIMATFTSIRKGLVSGGIVAFSQIKAFNIPAEEYWLIPQDFYAPLIQQAILLHKETPMAQEFLSFVLDDPESLSLLSLSGYLFKEKPLKEKMIKSLKPNRTRK